MMIEPTKLNVLYHLVDLDFHSRSQFYKKSKTKKLGVHFLASLGTDLDKNQFVATTCWFVETDAKFILLKYYSRERTLLM